MDSTGALELADIPERLLVIGGGIIGLEMATVYDALGSKVTVVELLDQLIPGCDKDLVKPLQKRIEKRYEAIHLGTKVEGVEATDDGLTVSFDGDDAEPRRSTASCSPSAGAPTARTLGADAAGVTVDDARLHRRRPPDAHERRRTSSPSATSSASRCSRTRRRTRARSRPR